jgi:hypothetical protein
MKPARQLVVHAPLRHVLQRSDDDVTKIRGFGAPSLGRPSCIPLNQQIQRRRMRKLRRLPEPPVLRIKHLECGFLNRRGHARRHPPAPPRKRFRLRNCALHHLRLLHHVAVLFRISVGNAQQHPPKAGTPIPIAGRKIGPPIKRFPVGRKKRRQRPPALPAHRLHRCLIPAVNVRTLVPIHLHRDEMLIHNRRNLRIVIRLPVHHMTPVTPHRPNVEQHRLVLPLRRRKGVSSPLMPLNRLMHGGSQVSRGSAREGVQGGGSHASSLYGRTHERMAEARLMDH